MPLNIYKISLLLWMQGFLVDSFTNPLSGTPRSIGKGELIVSPLQQVSLDDPYTRNGADRKTTSSSDRTEVSRMKFRFSQLKGTLQESEMRATAAEHRVALLQKEIKDLGDGTKLSDADADADGGKIKKIKKEHKKEVGTFNAKIKELSDAMEHFKLRSKKETENMKNSFNLEKEEQQNVINDFQSKLEKAGNELTAALEDLEHLRIDVATLEDSIQEMEVKFSSDIYELTVAKDTEICELKQEADDERSTLLGEKQVLSRNLAGSEELSLSLKKELEQTKIELTGELISFKEESRKDLYEANLVLKRTQADLEARDLRIMGYEAERLSMRKLIRLQGSLMKKRIRKRLPFGGKNDNGDAGDEQ